MKEREKAVRKENYKRRDPNVIKWLKTARYRDRRKAFLSKNPLCVVCGKRASILDHEVPHKGNYADYNGLWGATTICKFKELLLYK